MEENEIRTVILYGHSKAVEVTYCRKQKPVPFVSKKRQGHINKFIDIAKKKNVPIFHKDTLTKIFYGLEIGEMVPDDLYQVVAEIFAHCQCKQSEL